MIQLALRDAEPLLLLRLCPDDSQHTCLSVGPILSIPVKLDFVQGTHVDILGRLQGNGPLGKGRWFRMVGRLEYGLVAYA